MTAETPNAGRQVLKRSVRCIGFHSPYIARNSDIQPTDVLLCRPSIQRLKIAHLAPLGILTLQSVSFYSDKLIRFNFSTLTAVPPQPINLTP